MHEVQERRGGEFLSGPTEHVVPGGVQMDRATVGGRDRDWIDRLGEEGFEDFGVGSNEEHRLSFQWLFESSKVPATNFSA